jgi:hypothetical protein
MPSIGTNHGRVAFCFTLASSLWLAGNLHASYIFQDIINPGDTTFNQELGINNAGAISGYFGSGQMGHPNQGYKVAPPGYTTFRDRFLTEHTVLLTSYVQPDDRSAEHHACPFFSHSSFNSIE